MSPTYAFCTTVLPNTPAAVGSAWSAFFRPLLTSPMDTQPLPLPDPLEIAVHEPVGFPINAPVSGFNRYMALPAFGALAPRPGSDVSRSGKYPDPTITALVDRSLVSGPTAGSDQVKPTVFSAGVAVDLRSPK